MNLKITERGYITAINKARYFGFLVKGGNELTEKIFWHATALVDTTINEMYVGAEVKYKTIETEKGIEAVAVQIIKGESKRQK